MYAVIGALANAARGGQFKHLLNVSGDAINTAVYAATVLYLTHSLVITLLSAVAMFIGAAPGWGAYIGAILGKPKAKEQWWIDDMITLFDGVIWGVLGLTLRGLFWGLCLALPFALHAQWGTAIHFVAAGASMGLVYWFTIRVLTKAFRWVGSGWALSELIFGAILWGAL